MATFFYALLKTFDYTSVVLGQDSDDDAKAPHVAPIDKIWHARMGFTREQRTAMLASGVRADDIERQEASMVALAAKPGPAANGHANGAANGGTYIPADAFVSGRPKHTTRKSGMKSTTDPEKRTTTKNTANGTAEDPLSADSGAQVRSDTMTLAANETDTVKHLQASGGLGAPGASHSGLANIPIIKKAFKH